MGKLRFSVACLLSSVMCVSSFLAPFTVYAENLVSLNLSTTQDCPDVPVEDDSLEALDSTSSEARDAVGDVVDPPAVEDTSVNDQGAASIDAISISAHVQDMGWMSYVKDGRIAGTTGKSKRIEAVKVKLTGTSADGSPLGANAISVTTHVSGIGWLDPVGNDAIAGTTGKSKAVEAVKLQLSDELASQYDIFYRVHASNFGWLGWASNGDPAGSAGYARQVEAIQIEVLPKNSSSAPSVGDAFKNRVDEPASISYSAHLSGTGWGGAVSSGATAGHASATSSIEALSMSLSWYAGTGAVAMRGHVSGEGWQSWNSGSCGTTGRSHSLEAVQLKLTGQAADSYDIWYRVYSAKNGGWSGWATNGLSAGSSGKGAAIQGFQAILLSKGSAAPGSADNRFQGNVDRLSGVGFYVNNVSESENGAAPLSIGSTKSSRLLSSFALSVVDRETDGSISYQACFSRSGWQSSWAQDGAQLHSANDGESINAIRVQLSGALAERYDVWYRAFTPVFGWSGWASNGVSVGRTGDGSGVTAIEVELSAKGSTAPGASDNAFVEGDSAPGVVAQAHVSGVGWLDTVSGDAVIGTTGQSRALEAVGLKLNGFEDSSISVRAHVSDIGWQNWVSDGSYFGTVGQSKAIQAISLKLQGPASDSYDIWYRVHASGYGWLGWAKNGEDAGTTGLGVRAEALQIKLVEKGAFSPSDNLPALVSSPNIAIAAHVEGRGWLNPVGQNGVAGTTGQSLRVEALKASWQGAIPGGIEISSHVEGVGWQDWAKGGSISGTVGKSRRVEAVKMRLSGTASQYYDIWYRVHAQSYGWMGWTSNGSKAGTEGVSYRVEAVQVVITSKGASAPGSTARPFTTQPMMPSDQLAMLNRANWYSSNTGWLIMVDTVNCKLGVFRGFKGNWSYAQFWQCSTGAPQTPTVLGEYSVTGKGYSFGHGYTCYYYTQFYGDYLIHSGTYYQGTFNVMDDRMGVHISQGCVRLLIDRAKWIWDNVPIGTKVVTY